MQNWTISAVLFITVVPCAFAGLITPEISGSTAAGALALLSGGLLVLRGRRKK